MLLILIVFITFLTAKYGNFSTGKLGVTGVIVDVKSIVSETEGKTSGEETRLFGGSGVD